MKVKFFLIATYGLVLFKARKKIVMGGKKKTTIIAMKPTACLQMNPLDPSVSSKESRLLCGLQGFG